MGKGLRSQTDPADGVTMAAPFLQLLMQMHGTGQEPKRTRKFTWKERAHFLF